MCATHTQICKRFQSLFKHPSNLIPKWQVSSMITANIQFCVGTAAGLERESSYHIEVWNSNTDTMQLKMLQSFKSSQKYWDINSDVYSSDRKWKRLLLKVNWCFKWSVCQLFTSVGGDKCQWMIHSTDSSSNVTIEAFMRPWLIHSVSHSLIQFFFLNRLQQLTCCQNI